MHPVVGIGTVGHEVLVSQNKQYCYVSNNLLLFEVMKQQYRYRLRITKQGIPLYYVGCGFGLYVTMLYGGYWYPCVSFYPVGKTFIEPQRWLCFLAVFIELIIHDSISANIRPFLSSYMVTVDRQSRKIVRSLLRTTNT